MENPGITEQELEANGNSKGNTHEEVQGVEEGNVKKQI